MQKWININESAPKHGQHVLVWTGRDNVFGYTGDCKDRKIKMGDAEFIDQKSVWEEKDDEDKKRWASYDEFVKINGPRYRWHGQGPCMFSDVTYWMPLPQPPKTNEKSRTTS